MKRSVGKAVRTRRARLLALVTACALIATIGYALLVGGDDERVLPAPFAAGTGSANIDLNASGEAVVTRWVARRSGAVRRLHFHVKVEGSDDCPYGGRSGYAAGTTGTMVVTTHPVTESGQPRLDRTLAREEFRPCGREQGETVAVDAAGLRVTEGTEYATVVRNGDRDPGANFFSLNLLWSESGLVGANSENERDADADGAYYGLDPRELVGYSTDAGRTWKLPGGPYGPKAGRAFIPTYLVEYADGTTAGQPYYSSAGLSGPVTVVYPAVAADWKIEEIGAFTTGPGRAAVELRVDGRRRARADLSGTGMVRTGIEPVEVERGQTVTLTTTSGDGSLALRDLYADAAWERIAGLGRGHAQFLEANPARVAPLYPLPAYPGQRLGEPAAR